MKRNNIIIICCLILTIFGIMMITSASSIWANFKFNNPYKYTINQSIFATIGFILMFIISKIDYHIYYKHSNKILFIVCILLILVLIPGIGVIRNGSRSWFSVGPFSLQPSELAKISLIIFVSKYCSKYENKMDKTFKYAMPIFFIILLNFFLILLEPDFGSGVVLTLSVIIIIFMTNIKLSLFFKLGIVGLIGIVILIILAPYRMERIISFINPWSDPLGSGYQIIQSYFAIGHSGLFGVGLGNSIQKQFYLPEPQTDFIFAIISEELGIIGIIILSSIYIILFYNIIIISLSCKDKFSSYLSFGIIAQLILQTLLNIMVVVGLIPVTGVTLPFLSYGGSSLLITLCSMGIILNISRYQR